MHQLREVLGELGGGLWHTIAHAAHIHWDCMPPIACAASHCVRQIGEPFTLLQPADS